MSEQHSAEKDAHCRICHLAESHEVHGGRTIIVSAEQPWFPHPFESVDPADCIYDDPDDTGHMWFLRSESDVQVCQGCGAWR